MANEIIVPNGMTTEDAVSRIVAYLRKQAAAFDKVIEEADAAGEDSRAAKVKRMSVNVMADRVERGEWMQDPEVA